MNSLAVFLAIFACAFAQPQGRYRPVQPGQQIAILRQSNDISPDGSYQWSYETENGISAQEQGGLKNLSPEPGTAAQGAFQYTSPEGAQISLQYVADENGFQPQGAHLPVAPEIPPAIQRALAWIAAHPEPEQPGRRF